MVSQADRELINDFVSELRPYFEAVDTGVKEFGQPNRDGVVVGQAVQALVMIRGACQILMVDGLVSISSWVAEAFEKIQNNPEITPKEAVRRLTGLYSAMEDYLEALDRGDDVDPIVLRAKTIFEAIPAFAGPMPGTSTLRPRTDLDALFGEDQASAQTERLGSESADTEKLAAEQAAQAALSGPTAEEPEAGPTVPLWQSPAAETKPVTPPPARIIPTPPQPTERIPTVDPELREIFEEEAHEIIGAFGDGIRELAKNPSDFEASRRLNRAAHTLKGAANMTGFPTVAQIGAAIEQLFDEHLERETPVSREVLELVAVSWKMLRAMLPKLDDLSGFTSPSNSIVHRANVLREQIASEVADADTIPMEHQQFGTRPAADEEPVVETDEVVSVDVHSPEPVEHVSDELLIESTPTVQLPQQPPGAESVDATPDVAEVEADVVVEPDADDAIDAEVATFDEDVQVEAEPVVEGPASAPDEMPFWPEPEDLAVVEDDPAADLPQSEPFWTPGTESLMRSSVHTDKLIADLHDLDDLIDSDDEALAVSPDMETEAQPNDTDYTIDDDGEWLNDENRPGTDLLKFDDRPQTEPFWQSLDDDHALAEPEAEHTASEDESFFEPVDVNDAFGGEDVVIDPVADPDISGDEADAPGLADQAEVDEAVDVEVEAVESIVAEDELIAEVEPARYRRTR